MDTQYFTDEMLKNEALQINLDFTLLEQLKIAKNIIDLVCGDIVYNLETNDDKKDSNTLTTISLQLAEIIKRNEAE